MRTWDTYKDSNFYMGRSSNWGSAARSVNPLQVFPAINRWFDAMETLPGARSVDALQEGTNCLIWVTKLNSLKDRTWGMYFFATT